MTPATSALGKLIWAVTGFTISADNMGLTGDLRAIIRK